MEKEYSVRFNFSPVACPKHRIGALCKGTYRQILNSDDVLFGGTGAYPSRNVKADPIPWDNKEYSVEFDVPPCSVTAFAFNWTQPEPAEKPASKKKLAAILKAVKESDKSYDEIMAFLES